MALIVMWIYTELSQKIWKTSRGKDEILQIVKVKCQSCGELNDEDAQFCKSCGGKI